MYFKEAKIVQTIMSSSDVIVAVSICHLLSVDSDDWQLKLIYFDYCYLRCCMFFGNKPKWYTKQPYKFWSKYSTLMYITVLLNCKISEKPTVWSLRLARNTTCCKTRRYGRTSSNCRQFTTRFSSWIWSTHSIKRWNKSCGRWASKTT